jgi:hypothetical protein
MRQWWRAVVRFFIEGLHDDLAMPHVTSPPGGTPRR